MEGEREAAPEAEEVGIEVDVMGQALMGLEMVDQERKVEATEAEAAVAAAAASAAAAKRQCRSTPDKCWPVDEAACSSASPSRRRRTSKRIPRSSVGTRTYSRMS